MNKEQTLKQIFEILVEVKHNIKLSARDKISNLDAEFGYMNGVNHYEEHMKLGELPVDMTLKQYLTKSKIVSEKSIGGGVKAYNYRGNRTAKTDGSWFVSYVGGVGGTIITSFPMRGGTSRFFSLMKRDGGKQVFRE